MHLTPEILEGAYIFLKTTPPFRRWKLPHHEEVEFKVSATRSYAGSCRKYVRAKRWIIEVSTFYVGLMPMLIETMAHEMVHLYQDLRGSGPKAPLTHNAEFKRLAAQICREHGFDPKLF